jgi:hypothetical protein
MDRVPFGDHALQDQRDKPPEKLDPSPLDMIEIQKSCLDARNQGLQSALALEERPVAQVVAVDA